VNLDAAPLRLLAPLDVVRSALLRALGPTAGVWSARRDLRVAFFGVLAMTTALFGAAYLPGWMLAFGPIVLGVPHIVSDLRYLVAKPGFHRRGWGALVVGTLLAGTAIFGMLAPGIVAVIAAALFARGSLVRKVVVVGLAGAWLAATLLHRGVSELVFAHAHNLIAVLLFWVWRERSGRLHWLPLAYFVFALALFASGAFDRAALKVPVFGASLGHMVRELGGGLEGPWALRLVLAYAFAQSVHYGVWLRLVPEEDRERPGPRSFASSYRALVRDVGRPLVGLAALSLIALIAWAIHDLAYARWGYLRVAIFHGPLELVAAAYFFIEAKRPFEATSAARSGVTSGTISAAA
jgi:hypothetical protein